MREFVSINLILLLLSLSGCSKAGLRHRSQQCRNNISNLKLGLETYKADNGSFPSKLSDLAPKYLPSVPVCNVGGKDTYSPTYIVSGDGSRCTFCCEVAEISRKIGSVKSFPQYDSAYGIVYR